MSILMMSDSQSVLTQTTVRPSTQDDSLSTPVPLAAAAAAAAYDDESPPRRVQQLPLLPSHRYKHSQWHEIESQWRVTGDRLHAPRVRDGPAEKEEIFYCLGSETQLVHHSKRGGERRDHRNEMENWEEAEVCNLSYQHLGHSYQTENFLRILRRLPNVVILNLLEDELVDLSACTFPLCEHLDLSRNFLNSFKKLPVVPRITTLILTNNDVRTLDGLDRLKKSPIASLNLIGNPVAFTLNYRQTVFHKLPQLTFLDELPRLPEDDTTDPDHKEVDDSSCTVL